MSHTGQIRLLPLESGSYVVYGQLDLAMSYFPLYEVLAIVFIALLAKYLKYASDTQTKVSKNTN